MNKQNVELVGRAVVKPTPLKSKDKKSYSKVRIAVNRKSKDAKGKDLDLVTYNDILVFGKRAESSKNLTKGTLIRTVGNLEVKPYLTKKGEPKADLTVFAREFQVLDTEIFKK